MLEIKEHVKLYNYTPDFYIKDNDLYLEHFGVNRDCNALWRDEEGQKEYRDGIYWKRATHKGYGSKLHYELLRKYGPSPIDRKSFLKKFYAAEAGK